MHGDAWYRTRGALGDAFGRAVLAVCVSAVLAFLANRALARYMGESRAALAAALVEEALKTLPAAASGAPVILVHFLFGVVESVYDARRSPPRQGRMAAAASVLGHTAFGVATACAWVLAGHVAAGLGAGILLHLCWNILITGGMDGAPQGNR